MLVGRSLIVLLHFLLFVGGDGSVFAEGRFTVTVLDCTTHGLAIVLQTPGGGTWLVDTGLHAKDDHYPARDDIVPFLQRAGVKALEGVLISHPHADHYGGLAYVLDKYQVGRLVDAGYHEIGGGELDAYRQLRAGYVQAGGKSVIVRLGSKLDLDPELDAEILWPPPGLHRPDPAKKDEQLYNANSIVLRVRHGARVFLLPGDHHGLAGMAKFVPAEKLKCDFLVAPHHGINSNPTMAQATRPHYVVVSAKHERPTDRERPYELTRTAFGPVGAEVFATSVHGNITAVSDGRTIQVRTAKPGAAALPGRLPVAAPVDR